MSKLTPTLAVLCVVWTCLQQLPDHLAQDKYKNKLGRNRTNLPERQWMTIHHLERIGNRRSFGTLNRYNRTKNTHFFSKVALHCRFLKVKASHMYLFTHHRYFGLIDARMSCTSNRKQPVSFFQTFFLRFFYCVVWKWVFPKYLEKM